jgi:MFS family permease
MLYCRGSGGELRGRRWVIWGTLAAMFWVVNFHRYALGTIYNDLMATFRTSAAGLGGLSSVYYYVYGAMQVPSGLLADRWGPGRTVTAGALVIAAGTFAFALAPTFGWALAGRAVASLGLASVLICALKVQAAWFSPAAFATLTGLLAGTAGNLGALTAGAPLAYVAAALGWRGPFVAVGLLTLALGVVAWALLGEEAAAPARRPTAGRAGPGALARLGAALSNPALWPALGCKAAFDATHFAFMALWGVPYFAQVYGLPRAEAALLVSAAILGFIPGAPVWGALADRLLGSRRRPLLIGSALLTVLWLILWSSASIRLPLLACYPLLVGIGFTASSLLVTLSAARDASTPETLGVSAALVNGGGFLGAAMFQVVSGAVLDRSWQGAIRDGVRLYPVEGYARILTLLAAVQAAGTVAAWFVPDRLRRPARQLADPW